MSDQDLRDKLASEARPLGNLLSPYEQDLWCDGWDAARANPLRDEKRLWDDCERLRKERDQLREHNRMMQAEMETNQRLIRQYGQERDELREALAEYRKQFPAQSARQGE
jgi:hypothetical protein